MTRLVSDAILEDTGAVMPANPLAYPMLESDFELWNPNSWTQGHPYGLYARMRSEAPVMWSKMGRGGTGFWSVSRYEDIKAVELQPQVFSSERGGINLAVPPRQHWKPEILVRAAMDNLIDQQEETEHDNGVEIGVLAAAEGFEHADAKRQT